MRIRAIAALGLAAVTVLTVSACRIEQGSAVFIGDHRISEDRVDEIVDSVPVAKREELGNITTGNLRSYVVSALTTVEVGRQVAADTGVKPDTAAGKAVEKVWESSGLDGDSDFVKLAVATEKYRAVLFAGAKAAKPTDEEIDANAAQFGGLTDLEHDQLRDNFDQWLNSEAGQEALGRQRQVDDYLVEYDVTANPRYGQTRIVIAPGNSRLQPPPVFSTVPSS